MNVLGLSAQATSIATTTYGISLVAVLIALIGSWMVIRWNQVQYWTHRILHRPKQRSIAPIVDRMISQLMAIPEGRERVQTILSRLGEMSHTPDISLIARKEGEGPWQLQEVVGARPMSCQMEMAEPFLQALSKSPNMMSRRALVEDGRFAGIKGVGLQYCVQFHANWMVPLVVGKQLIAVINLGQPLGGKAVLPEVITLVERLRPFLALCVQNAAYQEAMSHQHDVLAASERLKSQLLSNLSHELRTPIHSMIGLADVIREGNVPEGETPVHYAGMIAEAGRRLMETLSTMMDLAKLETHNVTLDVKRVNLAKLMRKISMEVTPNPKVKVDLRLPEDNSYVYGDGHWITLALHHLFSNALKYTPDGEVVVDMERTGEMVKIGVHDTGIGIAKDRQHAIFEGFTQEKNGMDRPYEGSGLGLAITRKIVELHGGRIAVDSTPGRGSHFFVTFPLKPIRVQSRELKSCVNH